MAITPIDLQTMFSQVDKVGKTQAAQKEGQALHQAMQGVNVQRKMEEQIKQVNEAQNSGDGAEKVKDRNHDQDKQNPGRKNDKNNSSQEEEEQPLSVLRDPSLGNKIDISL